MFIWQFTNQIKQVSQQSSIENEKKKEIRHSSIFLTEATQTIN